MASRGFLTTVCFVVAGGVNVLRDAVLAPLALVGLHVEIGPAIGTWHP